MLDGFFKKYMKGLSAEDKQKLIAELEGGEEELDEDLDGEKKEELDGEKKEELDGDKKKVDGEDKTDDKTKTDTVPTVPTVPPVTDEEEGKGEKPNEELIQALAEVERLKAENTTLQGAQTDLEAKLTTEKGAHGSLKRTSLLEKQYSKALPKDKEAIQTYIDKALEGLEDEAELPTKIEDAYKALITEKPYLFEEKSITNQVNQPPTLNHNMSVSEIARLTNKQQ